MIRNITKRSKGFPIYTESVAVINTLQEIAVRQYKQLLVVKLEVARQGVSQSQIDDELDGLI